MFSKKLPKKIMTECLEGMKEAARASSDGAKHFGEWMELTLAVWLSPLILTIALAGIGWTMIRGARERVAHEGLVPRRTTTTLKEDTRWAQAKVHEIKEEISHGR